MKNIWLLSLLLLTLLLSCGPAKNIPKDAVYVSDRRVEKKYFFSMFKMDVFLSSVQYAFNDSHEIRKLLSEDKSNGGAGEAIDTDDVIKVGKMLAGRIKLDSAKNTNGAPDDLRGKTVFKTCLEFYNSKELYSIAKKLYKDKYSKPLILYPKTDSVILYKK